LWSGQFEVPGGDPTRGGWVVRDGRLRPIVHISKRTRSDVASLAPIAVDMTMTDDDGRDYRINGAVVAANRFAAWPTMNTWVCLARWEWDGRVCFGDLQEVQWHDYTHHFLGAS